MDNQHRKITGYRELDQSEIDMMNKVKSIGEDVGDMVAKLQNIEVTDKRWVAIARTHFQEGFMAAVRSIAKPESF